MNEEERLNALEIALNNEMKERAFYLRHAARTKNPVGKAMFQQIGDEELEHYERLKELHARWEKQEKWPETLPLRVNDTVVKNLLLDSVKGVDVKSGGDDDDLEAIRVAIEFEAHGAKSYAMLRDSVQNPKEKEFFSLLAQIENEHYLSLKDVEEFLTDPESYYRRIEHHGMDGG